MSDNLGKHKSGKNIISIPGLIIIAGLQGSGKSWLIKYLMRENKSKFDWGIVFTNTGFLDGNFDYIDKKFVHSRYNHQALLSLKNIQEKLISEGKKPSAFVLFDDALYGKQWRDEEFLNLLTQLRHYNITCILSCQYPNAIPPVIRTNAFQVIMFNMASKIAIKALYESYGQMFESESAFKKYLFEHTGNHCFVLYNARSPTPTIEGRYCCMRAPKEIPDFTLKFKTKL